MTDKTKPPTDRPVAIVPTVTDLPAIVRIDAAPGPRKFQGVYIEVADRGMWIIDYRARPLWKPFENVDVLVSGGCYVPFGEAVDRPHFRVDRMRPAKLQRGIRPYLEIGAEQLITGELLIQSGSSGTKMAGSTVPVFAADDGTAYVALGENLPETAGRIKVRARVLEPDMTYAARTSGPDLWIVDVHDVDYVADPAHAPRPIPCP